MIHEYTNHPDSDIDVAIVFESVDDVVELQIELLCLRGDDDLLIERFGSDFHPLSHVPFPGGTFSEDVAPAGVNYYHGNHCRISVYSDRERDIILLICEGKTNKEIASDLFISPVTVRDHLSRIFEKTNTKSRLQLANLFHENSDKQPEAKQN